MFGKKLTNRSQPHQAGFTLIELLVVITLTVMLMLTASAMFMTFLLGNTKTSGSQLVKNEGKYALTQMEFLLRNAVQIVPNDDGTTCQNNMNEIAFLSYDSKKTRFFEENDKIASNSGVYLTSTGVELVDGPNFNCSKSIDDVLQYVTITFTLRKGTPGIDQAKEITVATFSGSATVRSY